MFYSPTGFVLPRPRFLTKAESLHSSCFSQTPRRHARWILTMRECSSHMYWFGLQTRPDCQLIAACWAAAVIRPSCPTEICRRMLCSRCSTHLCQHALKQPNWPFAPLDSTEPHLAEAGNGRRNWIASDNPPWRVSLPFQHSLEIFSLGFEIVFLIV